MERKLFPDGFYYRDFGGELRKERWTETLAHERIDNIFERLEKLEGNRPDLWERIAELDSKIGELQAQWDSHFDDTPKPHTCGRCKFVIEEYPHKIGFRLFCWRHEDGRYKYMVRDRMQACEKFEAEEES